VQRDLSGVRALAFDVFGTVVDYRTTIIREGRRFNETHGTAIDWAAFADAWRDRYAPSMARVMTGDLPWTNLDALHRAALNDLLPEFGIEGISEMDKDHLNGVWHRLEPWGDSVTGLARLKADYVLCTLSNGNVRLLVDMAKHAGLPWDLILSAELAHAYKPDPRAYRLAPDLLALRPDEVMMVAAHQDDLNAAREVGLRSAFVMRPLEHGPDSVPDLSTDGAFDLVATDIVDLARQLGT
jgi:2-haloacid dehalogenase